jgi:hypothetical protein
MAWPAPQNASSLSPLAPKGDHMCPLSKYRSKSSESQEGLHGAPFSLAHLMICHGPKIGWLHRWGSQPLCSHVEAALFHRDERYDYILAAMWSVLSVSSWICLDLPRSEAQNLGGWYSAASAGGTPTRNAPKSQTVRIRTSGWMRRKAESQGYPIVQALGNMVHRLGSSGHLHPGLQTAGTAGPSTGHTRLTGRGSTSRRGIHVRTIHCHVMPKHILHQYGK